MRVTFLGTGTSRGIPVIGCDCATCHSDDPKNKRLRASILIESEASVVIDTSADFRAQMLSHRVAKLDAVVLTHSHVDHILGLDDIFPFTVRSGKPMPVYGNRLTLDEVRLTFRHMFGSKVYPGVPRAQLLPVKGPFEIIDLEFIPIPVMHGKLPIYGYRIGAFAYITDVNYIPDTSMQKLEGLDVLVLDGLRHSAHPTHYTLEEASQVAQQLAAKKTWLIHMSHEVDHDEARRRLPASIDLAYDGLVLEVH